MQKQHEQLKTNDFVELPKEHYEELETYISGVKDKEGSLIHILHKAQEIFGYLPKEVQLFVSRQVGIPAAKVYGVVSFYSFFTQKPVGKHKISVCMGTACFVKKAEKILDAFAAELGINKGETTEDMLFTLRDVRCVGACGLAPVVFVGDNVHGHVAVEDVKEIIQQYRKGDE